MSYTSRALPSHLRHSSITGGQSASGQSPVLLARIKEKKDELAYLQQLKQLSAQLADQMQTLEEKLSTLSDGTEAVAAVLSNWHNVLRAINMASAKLAKPVDEGSGNGTESDEQLPLPQTLVRIPTQQAGALLSQSTSSNNAG